MASCLQAESDVLTDPLCAPTGAYRVTRLPRVLMLQLKRFTFSAASGTRHKMTRPVIISPKVSLGTCPAIASRMVLLLFFLRPFDHEFICDVGHTTDFCSSVDTLSPNPIISKNACSEVLAAADAADDLRPRRRLDFHEQSPSGGSTSAGCAAPVGYQGMSARDREQMLVDQAIAQSLMDDTVSVIGARLA